jgi:hypothetical protein
MRCLYLRAPIPERPNEDWGIITGRHHCAMKVAACPAFAAALRLAACEFRLEELKIDKDDSDWLALE